MSGFLILLLGMSLGFGFGVFFCGMVGRADRHHEREVDEHGRF